MGGGRLSERSFGRGPNRTGDHFGTQDERNTIADALNGLAILEREIDGRKKQQA